VAAAKSAAASKRNICGRNDVNQSAASANNRRRCSGNSARNICWRRRVSWRSAAAQNEWQQPGAGGRRRRRRIENRKPASHDNNQ